MALYKEAVEKRLRIKELDVSNSSSKPFDSDPQRISEPAVVKETRSFSAYFLNPVVVMNKATSEIAMDQLFPEISEFDIRIGCSNLLF